MNLFTIFMDNDRSLKPASYFLGVEGDHKIDKISLVVNRQSQGEDICNCAVSLHLKAEDGYYYNALCDEKISDDEFAVFFFPVTREMTCRNGKASVEFSFTNGEVGFSFRSRTADFMIAKPLTDGEDIESDYPGLLSDILNKHEDFLSRLDDTEKTLGYISEEFDGVKNTAYAVSDKVNDIQAYLGYDDENILGLEADFENNTFTRLAGAKGREAGEDFNKFSIYRDRVRCNVADDGTITALYGYGNQTLFDGDVVFYDGFGDSSLGVGEVFSDEIPHVSSAGKEILINVTVGEKEYQFKSVLGIPGAEEEYGTFEASDGTAITLKGFPRGDLAGETVAEYVGGFMFFAYPYTSDTVHISVTGNTDLGAYADDGSNGQVMVYQPKFYYRVVPTKLEKIENGAGYNIRKANYYISATPRPNFKLHPAFYDANGKEANYILYSAYEGCVYGDVLASVSGAKPTSSYTRSEFEAFAKARGNGWHIETIQALSANQLLMAIEFATFNMQSAIGLGFVNLSTDTSANRSCITGATAGLGNASGEATETVGDVDGVQTVYTESGKLSVSYRGMENPWGNIYKFANGITIIGYGENGDSANVCSGFSFNDSGSSSNYKGVGFNVIKRDGYIKGFGYADGEFDWIFLPVNHETAVGTSAYPVGDTITVESANFTGVRNFFYGGCWYGAENNGPFRYHIKNSVVGKYTFCGARLMFVKEAVI